MAEVIVAGAAGRMGSRLVALIQEAEDLALVAALEAPGHPALHKDAGEVAGIGRIGVPIAADPEGSFARDRILIEFSIPEASLAHLRLVAKHGGRAVIGTTGFSPSQRDEVERIARQVPVLLSPNMSVAVNVAFRVLADMARMLGDDYDVEITEVHHRFKKDAPSGTALRMGEIVAQSLGRELGKVAVYGRHGVPGERSRKEIGMLSLRSGDVVGEHTVSFGSLGERLELTHRSHSRDTFGRGALRAARFIATAAPGLYSMQDVLGLT
ncbi:MAG: 4-hydroxy-tetrahydrodipicolinate reductase [Candidatus Rokubacteria bacterium]|nr:4-hydroxy-tetrahydrodipicolinate reductase [Candidatus Rokubacteria bacterium]